MAACLKQVSAFVIGARLFNTVFIKVGLSLFNVFISFNESSLKMMKSAFHFILTAAFVLKIFISLS